MFFFLPQKRLDNLHYGKLLFGFIHELPHGAERDEVRLVHLAVEDVLLLLRQFKKHALQLLRCFCR